MPLQFRWTPDEEAWLTERILVDQGRSKPTDKLWMETLIANFQTRFPCAARIGRDGVMETQRDLCRRWSDVPWRVKKWIQNHQAKILDRAARSVPQKFVIRSLPKREKRLRAKSARDMALARDPCVQGMRKLLQKQVDIRSITKSEMAAQINNFVTQLLQDTAKNEHYANLAREMSKPSSLYRETMDSRRIHILNIVQNDGNLGAQSLTAFSQHSDDLAESAIDAVDDSGNLQPITPTATMPSDFQLPSPFTAEGYPTHHSSLNNPEASSSTLPVVWQPELIPLPKASLTYVEDFAALRDSVAPIPSTSALPWSSGPDEFVFAPDDITDPGPTPSYSTLPDESALSAASIPLPNPEERYHPRSRFAPLIAPFREGSDFEGVVPASTKHIPPRPPHFPHSPSAASTTSTNSAVHGPLGDPFSGDWCQQRKWRFSLLNAFALSGDGRFIVTGSLSTQTRDGQNKSILSFMDQQSNKCSSTLRLEREACVTTIALSPNNVCVAAGLHDGAVVVWDVRGGRWKMLSQSSGAAEPHAVTSVTFSHDSTKLAIYSSDDKITISNLMTGESSSFSVQETSPAVLKGVSFTLDDFHIVACSSPGRIEVWDAGTGRRIPEAEYTWFDIRFDWISSRGWQKDIASYEGGIIRRWGRASLFEYGWYEILVSGDRRYIAEWNRADSTICVYARPGQIAEWNYMSCTSNSRKLSLQRL